MGYALPTPTGWVTCSWQCHVDRPTPSREPGTDYGAGHGSALYAVDNGTVTYIKTTPSRATGRVIEYRLDDGRTTRSLHLSQVWVSVGQRVSKGQQIGVTGASGFGDEWFYGPHEHHTLWPGDAWAAPTIDFAKYVGGGGTPTPPGPPPEIVQGDDMEIVMTAPNGVVVHLVPGVKYDYQSIDEYNQFRSDINVFRTHASGNMMPLPAIQDVVGVNWDTYTRFCAYFGVAG